MTTTDDIINRFRYHPAMTAEKMTAHNSVRNLCLDLATTLNNFIPDGREKALAITKLEEVMFWANAAVARVKDQEN